MKLFEQLFVEREQKSPLRIELLERFFHIEERGSNLLREIKCGILNFFVLCYLMLAVPGNLAQSGFDQNSAITAACLCTGLACIGLAFFAKVPFVIGPGLSCSSLLSFRICQDYGFSWQESLALVFLSGLLFLLLACSPLRQRLQDVIPMPLKFALSAGLGLYISLSALLSSGLIQVEEGLLRVGGIVSLGGLLALLGIFLTVFLLIKHLPGASMISILFITLLCVLLKLVPVPGKFTAVPDLSASFFALDFGALFAKGLPKLFSALLSLVIANFVGSAVALQGIAGDAGLTDSVGDFYGQKRSLQVAAVSTSFAAFFGLSNLTVLPESAVGLREGARTGLCPLVTGILFLLAIPFSPLLGIFSGIATASVVILCGMMMMPGISQIRWKHVESSLPCFLIIIGIPATFSLVNGMALGCISYVFLMLFRKRGAVVDPWLYALSAVFILDILLRTLL
ncbi:MAG: NCS2 family permease [Bacillota bacterium]|nr:NCS2 family permease [Bacillota bacterium]